MTPLFKKLNLGSHDRLLVLNAPQSFEEELSQLTGVKVIRRVSSKLIVPFAIGFAISQADCDRVSAAIAQATRGDAIVWLAYPKRSSKNYRCDFSRDTGWTVLGTAGFEAVRQVAIDADWSALRFRRTEFIQSLTRENTRAISAAGKRRTTAATATEKGQTKSELMTIPGIGRTFVKDFGRIGVQSLSDLKGRDPKKLFTALQTANRKVGHQTSKNYLYVIRMAIYFANGGRDVSQLKWHAWKD